MFLREEWTQSTQQKRKSLEVIIVEEEIVKS